jgi:SGNH hydrolase-like domain, acetyltransferase AlgX
MVRGRASVLRTATLAAAVVLVALAAAEAAGRVFPALMPEQWQIEDLAIHYPFTVVPDADLGFSVPVRQRQIIRTRDYTFLEESDSHGFPNRDPWPPDPTLVLLGDSLLLGIGVGLDESFAGLLARRRPDQRVLNLGLAGAGPERQARVYKRYSRGWRPSLVVSTVFLASDVENDQHFLAWLQSGRRTPYNEFRLQLAGAVRDHGLAQRVLDHSWLLTSVRRGLLRLARTPSVPATRFRFDDGVEVLFERQALEFAGRDVSADDPRIDTFLTSVMQLRETVEMTGAQFLVMLMPSKEELYASRGSPVADNLADRIAGRLVSAGMPVLDLYPVFRDIGVAHATFFERDMHLTAYGNRIVADALAARLAVSGASGQ